MGGDRRREKGEKDFGKDSTEQIEAEMEEGQNQKLFLSEFPLVNDAD